MKEKNRFSSLLEHLMEVSELKNYTLAKELQYDVSYISKWVSGRMLPGSKTEKAVLQGISHCIVTDGSKQGLDILSSDYQVTTHEDLEGAIYDNLLAEYNYVKETQKDTGSTIAPKTLFFPKLNMPQYIARMHHPVLRRVKSLDIMAAMDLLAMDHEYRLQVVSLGNEHSNNQWRYPDVHFSMVIDLSSTQLDYVYDVVFLINVLSNMTHIDFRLYGSKQAYGRAIFAVKEDFAISGMLMESGQCLSVTVSEDPVNCGTLYRHIQSQCSRERLLVRRTSMQEMLHSNDYVRTLLSPNQRLLLGHLTEHFLPDELFESIVALLMDTGKPVVTVDELRWFHALTKRSYEQSPIRIMLYESALSEFAVTGELDFYNFKVRLTPEQRLEYMFSLRDMVLDHDNLSVKLVYGRLISDFQYIANQCLFLSDGTSYFRLDSISGQDSLHIINHSDMKDIFNRFYEEVWEECGDIVISDRSIIVNFIDHTIQQIKMISFLDE